MNQILYLQMSQLAVWIKKTADEIFDLLKKQITPNRLILFATHNRFSCKKVRLLIGNC